MNFSRPLYWMVILFIGLRMMTLLTAAERVAEPEEVYRGNIAVGLMRGLPIPILDYQVDPYSGGSLVVGFLAVPFFQGLGPNLFALKLVPLLFSVASLILLFFFMKRYFSESAAILACLLFLFSPPAFTAVSFYAMGYHSESILFSMAILFFFYQFVYDNRDQNRSLILFGLAGGLAFSFTYITLITEAACLLSLLGIKRFRFRMNQAILFAIAFGIGLIPFMSYNVTHHFGGIRFIINAFYQLDRPENVWNILTSTLSRWVQLITREIPLSLCFDPLGNIPGAFFSYLYYGMSLSVIAFLIWKERRLRIVPLLIYPVLMILLYSLSLFEIESNGSFLGFRYLTSVQFFLFPLLALGLERLESRGLFLIPFLTLGVLAQASLLFQEPFGRAWAYKGYSYTLPPGQLKALFADHRQFRNIEPVLKQFKNEERPYVYWAAVYDVFLKQRGTDPTQVQTWLRDTPAIYQPYLTEGLGGVVIGDDIKSDQSSWHAFLAEIPRPMHRYFYRTLAFHAAFGPPGPFMKSQNSWLMKDETYRRWFYDHLGRFLGSPPEEQGWEEAQNIFNQAGPDERSWVYRGLGQTVGDYWILARVPFHKIFDLIAIPVTIEAKPDLFWGIGWAIRELFPGDRIRALDWIQRVPREFQTEAKAGFEAYEHWYRL